MGNPKKLLPMKEVERLYRKEGLSPHKIALLYGCTSVTVRTRLIEAGVALKTKSVAQTKYPRQPYSGTDIDKAYMLGFRYGDLNVYQPTGKSETIVVRSHSTHKAQCELFTELFSEYGTITTSQNALKVQMTCYLDLSFSFLLTKYPSAMREWVLASSKKTNSFIAGYVDAEGTFGLNQGKGRFKIDSYDYQILSDIHDSFINSGLNSKFRKIATKGEDDYGWIWKEDLWRVGINKASSLEKLIQEIGPYMRHKKRIADSAIVMQNVAKRRLHGSIQ